MQAQPCLARKEKVCPIVRIPELGQLVIVDLRQSLRIRRIGRDIFLKSWAKMA